MDSSWGGALAGIIGCVIGNALWVVPHAEERAFKAGCKDADPGRVVAEINGKQRCLTEEQFKAVKR